MNFVKLSPAVALALLAGAGHAQELVQNGGFEQPPISGWGITVPAGSGTVGPWTVTGAGLDLVNDAWDAAAGLNSISMNWTGPSVIAQTVSTTPGASYSLSFAMAAEIYGGPLQRSLEVRWNGALVDTVTFTYTGQGPTSMGWEQHQYTVVGTGSDTLSFVSTTSGHYGPALDAVSLLGGPQSYCTSGTSASGCQPTVSAAGIASATAASGFDLAASDVEGQKDGLFFFGANGRQANPWGNGTSYQCVIPPVKRGGLLTGTGTAGACDGAFAQDLNALWCAACPKPLHNPGAGAVVQAQLWYRDPQSTSNQTTSLSDALEFVVAP